MEGAGADEDLEREGRGFAFLMVSTHIKIIPVAS